MLSVVIIAKNEAVNIARCLKSVQWADEIIVFDSGSNDNTVAIAKTFTPHVVETDWQGYGIQKQRALLHAKGDWVLNLDADEAVSDDLKNLIIQAMMLDKADAYRIPIQMFFYGKPLRFSSSPKRHIRLFKRKNAKYSQDIVHEKIILPENARIERFNVPIEHHSYRDISHALFKMNRYSSYSAKISLNNQKKMTILKALTGSWWMFFRCYILQRGFLDGKAGLIFSVLNAQGSWYRGIKQLYPDCLLDELPNTQNQSESPL